MISLRFKLISPRWYTKLSLAQVTKAEKGVPALSNWNYAAPQPLTSAYIRLHPLTRIRQVRMEQRNKSFKV